MRILYPLCQPNMDGVLQMLIVIYVSSMMMGVHAGNSPGLESGSIGVGQKEQFKNPPIRMEKDTKVVFV